MSAIEATADLFVSQQSSAHTQRAYRTDIARLFNFRTASAILGIEDAVRFRDELSEALSPASAARVYNTCRAFVRFAIGSGVMSGPNPFEMVKAPRRIQNRTPEVPTDSDVEATLHAASTEPLRRLIVCLLLNGLRAQEVCDLTQDSIRSTPDGTLLRVVGKGMKERLVPATFEVEMALVNYANKALTLQKSSNHVVSDYDGTQLRMRQVEHAVYKSAEYAGVVGMHPHALRHHYATRLIRAGASVLHVQKLLGHSRADTTQVYVTLDTSDLFEAARKDPRNSRPVARLVAVA